MTSWLACALSLSLYSPRVSNQKQNTIASIRQGSVFYLVFFSRHFRLLCINAIYTSRTSSVVSCFFRMCAWRAPAGFRQSRLVSYKRTFVLVLMQTISTSCSETSAISNEWTSLFIYLFFGFRTFFWNKPKFDWMGSSFDLLNGAIGAKKMISKEERNWDEKGEAFKHASRRCFVFVFFLFRFTGENIIKCPI